MPSLSSVIVSCLQTVRFAKAHVEPVAAEIAERWTLYFIWGGPGRGTGDHAKGLALDFMGYERGGGVNSPGPMRKQVCNEIAAYVLANRVRLNVTYLIWNRRIASPASNPPWSWRTYTGTNPHTDHVHVSFEATGTYRKPITPEDDDMAANAQQIIDMLKAQNAVIAAQTARQQKQYESLLFNVQQEDGRNDAEKARDKALSAKVDEALKRLAEIESGLEADDNEGNPS